MRTLNLLTLAVAMTGCLVLATPAQAIENVRGKAYSLSPKHGPWMIMVTSFRNVPEAEKKEGLTAEQAAAELVFELRKKGIPAYTYSQDAVKGEIETHDRLGRDDKRIFAAQRDMICVLAGNYESIEDGVGQKTLSFVKKYRPDFLKDSRSGAILRADAAQRGPLAGAFMTINPLIKPEDLVQRTIDKETKFMNAGIEYSLVKNPHKYTVRVATFQGKSATPLGNSEYRGNVNKFDLSLQKQGFNLDRAGEDAANLVAFLRKTKPDPILSEAYVYHDKYQSIVTIGGFDSTDDPRIRLIGAHYGPQLVPDARLMNPIRRASATAEEAEELPKVLTTHTEQLMPKDFRKGETMPLQVWTFDTEPKIIPVPRIK